jgi:glucosyl-dolichyl phosphate glucuronosyltransferase
VARGVTKGANSNSILMSAKPRPTLSVAICTWNRASLLFQTLERLTQIEQPDVPWELIVINNRSTDQTEPVLDGFMSRLPLRRVFEAEPGLSHARNAAIRHAVGDYIVWTDDDALVDKDWLRAYACAVKRWPEVAVFGGPVRPKFEGVPPAWLASTWQRTEGAFAVRDFGKEPIELDGEFKIPYGINFVVRMREQRQFPYNPKLGRKHGAGALGEETEVIRAILAAGSTGMWVPDALVEHWISKQRQTITYLRSYYVLVGKTYYRPPRITMLWGLRVWRKALRAELAYRLARLTGNPHRWVTHLINASTLWGSSLK